jgi:hypothetical protein
MAGAVVETFAGHDGRAVSGHGIGFAFQRVLGEERADETEWGGHGEQECAASSHECFTSRNLSAEECRV